MRLIKSLGQGLLLVLAALAVWGIGFALMGTGLMTNDKSLYLWLGRTVVLFYGAVFTAPLALQALTAQFALGSAARSLASFAYIATAPLLSLLLMPSSGSASRYAESWGLWTAIAALVAAMLCARMIHSPSKTE